MAGVMGPPAGISLAQPGDDPVWRAARKFEQMAIGQLLTPMFATVDLSQEAFGGGEGEAAWQPMMIGNVAAAGAGIGWRGASGAARALMPGAQRVERRGAMGAMM